MARRLCRGPDLTRPASFRLAAHAGASALAGLLAFAFTLAAAGALICGKPGPALALALLAFGAKAARPGPSADLDKETGR